MRVSGDLYSLDDSDAESFSEELTPSDGYFNSGGMSPPNAMVQDPSIDADKKPEPKMLIPTPSTQATARPLTAASHPAMIQSSSSRTNASPPRSQAPTPTSRPLVHSPPSSALPEQTEDMYEHAVTNGPPPAYTPNPIPTPTPISHLNLTRYTPNATSTQDPQEPISPQSARRYSTFAEQPQLERGFLLPLDEPQSMSSPHGRLLDERTPLSNQWTGLSGRRKATTRALFCVVVFTSLIALFATLFHSRLSKSPQLELPSKERLLDDNGPYCLAATVRRDPIVYEFPTGSDLTILQTTHDNDKSRKLSPIATDGEIRFRRLNSSYEHGDRPHLTVHIHVSDDDLQVVRSWDESTKSLKISTPKWANLDNAGRHCVSVEITAWVPEGAEFTNISIGSVSLDTRVIDDIDVHVSGEAKISSIAGDVFFPTVDYTNWLLSPEEPRLLSPVVALGNPGPSTQNLLAGLSLPDPMHPFASRRTIIETVTGDIKGVYPLLDYLGLSSQSGAISAGVLPQKALAEAPAPADLEAQTASGSIRIDFPIANDANPNFIPPPRNYVANVHSNSGSIDGFFYIGTLGSFKSTTGSLNFKALPIISSNDPNSVAFPTRFETHTVSGSTDAELLHPIFISRILTTSQQAQHAKQSPDLHDLFEDHEPYLATPPSKALFKHSESSDTRSLRTLQSKHSSNSASVSVIYPSVWEGSIHAKTVSGDISVKGRGIRIVREKKGWAYKELLARKGVDSSSQGSMAEMSDIAGDLDFRIGYDNSGLKDINLV